ncbi:MAG: septum formation initiator family protein [Clostridia bacterium]|nr:septum formation initiator family protein [Clostridia bacterium]
MSQYYTSGDDILAQKKTKSKETAGKDLAENFLQEKGYERQVKPREINGGRDRVPQNHTVTNKNRLNTALAKTPRTAKGVENIRKKEKKVSVSRMEVRRENAKTPFPIPYIFCIVLLTVIFLYVIHLYIEIDDLNAELTDYNNMIVDMKSEETELEIKKNNMYDLEEIERIAREEYGMVNRDQLPKEYITPDSEDQIEIIETQSGEAAPSVLMSGFAKTISNLLSYIN